MPVVAAPSLKATWTEQQAGADAPRATGSRQGPDGFEFKSEM